MGQSRRPHTVYLDPAKGVDIPAQRRELLDKGPVVRVAFPGNLEVWALTHDAPLRNALADESVFVRGWRNWRGLMAGEVDPTHPVANMLRVESMLARSGADHKRMRGLVQAAFTRRRVEALRPRIEEITNELLDRMDESDGVVDLKAAYSFPLPIRVISELLGLNEEDHLTLQTLVTRTLSGTDPEANADAFTFVASLIEAKRKNLDDGLISAMIEARAEDGDRLSETELIHNTLLLIIGGFETTMGMISNSVQLLLTHPDQLHLLRTGQRRGRTPSRSACASNQRWSCCRSCTPRGTWRSTASRSRLGTPCSSASARPTGTRRPMTTPTVSTSPAPGPAIWRSATAPTSVSGRRLPAWSS